MLSDFISFASVHLVTVSQQTANISRFCLVQKRLREKHGRMENLKVYNRIPDNSSIMADHMKTFDDYDIRGAPKTSEPVVCKMCGGWIKRTRGFTTGFALIWTMPGDMQVYPIFYDYRPHKHDEPVLLAETGPDHLYDDDDLDA